MPLPSVLLHDHLDGGVRSSTLIEMAAERCYDQLPSRDPGLLAEWFDRASAGSLEGYLESFVHPIALMQDSEALQRVAYEAVVDLAADGVVYAEIRFCPALHTERGLTHSEVVSAVSEGLSRGSTETGLVWGLILDGLRQTDNSFAMAGLAVSTTDMGVVGFDLAGPEAGHPPREHLAAFRFVRTSGLRLTIHAGEAAGADGPAFIAEAMDLCGAERIGHGVEIVGDCVFEDGMVSNLGSVARRVRDRKIPLEMCPSSNLATAGLSPEDHPIGALYRAGFNVTVNTDNRLMSTTSMSREWSLLTEHHDFTLDDQAKMTRRSLAAAFCDYEMKKSLWEDEIAPAYDAAGAKVDRSWQ